MNLKTMARMLSKAIQDLEVGEPIMCRVGRRNYWAWAEEVGMEQEGWEMITQVVWAILVCRSKCGVDTAPVEAMEGVRQMMTMTAMKEDLRPVLIPAPGK